MKGDGFVAEKIMSLILSLVLILSLCGCDFLTTDTAELLATPEPSGDVGPISEVIKNTAPYGYVLKYPARGNYRSAVIREDLDSDGTLESFAFYSITDGDVITMHINAICLRDGQWSSVAVGQIVAAGIDKVEFCDLDGDGISEILVGWQIYGTSEMQLGVYSLSENTLTQRMLQKYTHFTVCDLDQNDINEIFIIKTGTGQLTNSASLYSINETGVTELSSCEIDKSVKTVNEPIVSALSNGKPAVYIDLIKGVGAVTEVIAFEKGKLVNPLFDEKTGETTATLRAISFSVTDINEDNILEIPVQMDVPSVTFSDVSEKLYLTNWCSFNGETLTNQVTSMINVNDGYFFAISSKLVGKIAVLKDTENHSREIYLYDSKTMTVGSSLIYIKAVSKTEWDSGKYNNTTAQEILNDGKTSFVCTISEEGQKYGLDMEYVRANFKLFKTGVY